MRKGLRWEIRSGSCVQFWNDKWIGEVPLREKSLMEVASDCLDFKVRQYWVLGAGWRWNLLEQYLPYSLMVILASVVLSSDVTEMDRYVWKDGRTPFMVKQAYKLNRVTDTEDDWGAGDKFGV